MLIPKSPGKLVIQTPVAAIDCSNADHGYISAMQPKAATGKQIKICVSKGKEKQNFSLIDNGVYNYIPLCFGSGKYDVIIYQLRSGITYDTIKKFNITADIISKFASYLYPNTYCNYNSSSKCVAKSNEITANCLDDYEKTKSVYAWMEHHIAYDHDLAAKHKSGELNWWLVEPDETLNAGKSTCWGHAGLLAAMLRAQDIPTKICIGFNGAYRHAWNEIYLLKGGNIGGVVITANKWTRIDFTFMTSNRSYLANKFVSDDSRYALDYIG